MGGGNTVPARRSESQREKLQPSSKEFEQLSLRSFILNETCVVSKKTHKNDKVPHSSH